MCPAKLLLWTAFLWATAVRFPVGIPGAVRLTEEETLDNHASKYSRAMLAYFNCPEMQIEIFSLIVCVFFVFCYGFFFVTCCLLKFAQDRIQWCSIIFGEFGIITLAPGGWEPASGVKHSWMCRSVYFKQEIRKKMDDRSNLAALLKSRIQNKVKMGFMWDCWDAEQQLLSA